MSTERINQLAAIARAAHAGQTDGSGIAYSEHLQAVADSVTGESAQAVAWFHDSIEDHQMTAEQLSKLLSSDELAAVLLLTRDKQTTTYAAFIDRIATATGTAGELAREVKTADLRHNAGRMTALLLATKPHLAARYAAALAVLTA